MLVELECPLFGSKKEGIFKPYGKIEFHKGLNTVLGAKKADNSIGKSTFLMVIDFCFGGTDYADTRKKGNVIPYVGHHTINFAFEFNGKKEYYSRTTLDSSHVNICGADYKVQETIPLTEFNAHLFEAYQIGLPSITFRDVVGRYIRAYGRGNHDELNPLKYSTVPDAASIIALEKLFNVYAVVEHYQTDYDAKDKRKKGWKTVSDLGEIIIIPKNLTQFKQNQQEIERLKVELQVVKYRQDADISQEENERVGKTAALKAELKVLKRKRKRNITRLENLKVNLKEGFVPTSQEIGIPAEFFPDVNLDRLNMIENFHTQIQRILIADVTEEIANLETIITALDESIQKIESELREAGELSNLSEKKLKNIYELQKSIDTLEQANSGFETLNSLKKEVKIAKETLENAREKQLDIVQNLINQELVRYNDAIYQGKRHAPQIKFSSARSGKATYEFGTVQDGGTGTNWKNFIIFDLSILKLTPLPVIAHDSMMLKNIADFPVDSIIQLYTQFEKQIFITFDKEESFSKETQEILQKSKVLHLYDGGGELFGWSWAKKIETDETN